VAERSKALDWNSSNIFTGVRGFESHPLRQSVSMVVRIGYSATTSREPRQARKGAAAAMMSGAGARLVRIASFSIAFGQLFTGSAKPTPYMKLRVPQMAQVLIE
jgi:hypothetical protein